MENSQKLNWNEKKSEKISDPKLYSNLTNQKKSEKISREKQLIQVYETKNGIAVRDGAYEVQIDPGMLTHSTSVAVFTYIEDDSAELVYTYYGPLEVGQVYPHDAIKPELGMVVLNVADNSVCQYKFMGTHEKAYPDAWVVAGLTGNFKNLGEGRYQILKLGDA